MQRDVGDRILHQQLPGRRLAAAVVPAHGAPGVLALDQGVAPVAEPALGELHDVALVHQRDALALVQDGVVERGANEPLGPLPRNRLHADARRGREADVLHAHLVLQERDHLLRLGRFGGPLDAGVDVLRVLAEDHHVDLLGRLHGRRHALEVAHRAQADVEVQHLADGDVERPDAAADGRRQRPLDADEVGLERFQRLVGQPAVEQLLGLAARVHLGPGDLFLAAEFLADRGVEHAHAGAPDVGACAVAFDERNDRAIGDFQVSVSADGDGFGTYGDDRFRAGRVRHGRLLITSDEGQQNKRKNVFQMLPGAGARRGSG